MDEIDHPQVRFGLEAREINDTGLGKEDVEGVGVRVAQDAAGEHGLEGGLEPLAGVERVGVLDGVAFATGQAARLKRGGLSMAHQGKPEVERLPGRVIPPQKPSAGSLRQDRQDGPLPCA
jgi:hypothetical protein